MKVPVMGVKLYKLIDSTRMYFKVAKYNQIYLPE